VEKCFHTKPLPKDKFVVIAHFDQNAMGLLINTRVTDWLRRHPHLLACEATILAAEHKFLKYDSYVDCQDIFPFHEWELTGHRGEVSPHAKLAILAAIRDCPTIVRKYKTAILNRDGHLFNPNS
jgi:hypothetical protein